MQWSSFVLYLVVAAAAGACRVLARRIRIPAAALAVAAGLALGPAGFGLVAAGRARDLHPAVVVHVAVILGTIGYRLGRGLLRLPLRETLRRSLPHLSLAAAGLLAGSVLFPALLPDAEPERSFFRFALPLACVFAAYPLLAVRDLRGPPPPDVGSTFLVAVGLFGAVHSFTPSLLWGGFDPGLFWRGPILVLGESGALGIAAAVVHLLLARRLRLPRPAVDLMLLALLAEAATRFELWLPFSALGFGAALGRAGDPAPRAPAVGRWLFDETPFLLVVALSFAPRLYADTVALPSVVVAAGLAGFLLLLRARMVGGRQLVTGPGLLFLGLTLTVRLDPRMGPVARYTVDFALPAWVLLRLVVAAAERRERRAGLSLNRPHASRPL
jgi:hypothetical protein